MYLKTFALLLVCLQFVVSDEKYDKVNLTYGYQTRCPYCLKFLKKQFYSGYKQLSDYINLELIPVVTGVENGTVTCMHGANECFITRAQACAFGRPGVTDALRVEYLYCTEKKAIRRRDVSDSDIKACVKSVLGDLVSYKTVKTCMHSEESTTLIQEYDDIVNNYRISFVPWLGFFGVYDSNEQKELRSNFVQRVCQKLLNPPDICNQLINLIN